MGKILEETGWWERFFVLAVAISMAGAAFGDGRVWKAHESPYAFLFGNHIDTHQETRLAAGGEDEEGTAKPRGSLRGFFYVYWTGDSSPEGLPVAAHCTTAEHYAAGCFAAWKIEAKPCIAEVDGCEAMFLYHNHDHPVWLVGPRLDDAGGLRGTRGRLVQPGSFTHFTG